MLNQGVALPTEPNEHFYLVVSPKGSTALLLEILSDTFFGAINHWDGIPIACTGDPVKCYGCRNDLPRRWAGYLAAFLRGERKRVIGMLTEGAARQLLPVLHQRRTLRGLTVDLRRKYPKRQNSPVVVAVKGDAHPASCMPEHPVIPSLQRLWGLNLEMIKRGGSAPPPRLDDDGLGGGVPLPGRGPDDDRPSQEQWRQLRSVVGSIGKME